ncbi:MAG: hypothetical protein JXR03_12430 [Cyclobacteriaceae bacterium]
MVDIGLYAGYVLVFACILLTLVFYIVQLLGDKRLLLRALAGFGVVLVVFFVGYAMSSGESDTATEGTAKVVGAGIISMYIFLAFAIIGIVYTEISKMIK